MSMEIGVEFSQYRVIEHIGRGGMADVWSARDKRLSRTVAIKTVARDLSQDMNPVSLFEREARTIASLEHPHVLPIYEFGEYEGQLYIVMRYVSGGSLEDLLEDGPINVDETLRLGRLVAHALDYAHANNVIHLDLKPSNILLDSYRQPYLADFGLAAVLGPEGRAANPGSGTLLYMAPEQLTSENLDNRADIYSFTVMLFHMLTGQLPFDATVPLALKQIQLHELLPSVDKIVRTLPPQFNVVLRHGTESDPTKRPSSLIEIIQALESVLEKPATGGQSAPRARTNDQRVAKPNPLDLDTATARLDSGLLSSPMDDLITRSKPSINLDTDLNALITGSLGDLISSKSGRDSSLEEDGIITRSMGSIMDSMDNLVTGPAMSRDARTTQVEKMNLNDFSAVFDVSPENMAMREAEDLYKRAYRAWLHGQGRFLLGITHFMIVNDYYSKAADHKLEIDQSGREMMLRGALEYDTDIELWWAQVDDDSRRKVALHTVRSESAPARVRAFSRLEAGIADSEPPQIARLVAQALQTESNENAQIAAIKVLVERAHLVRAQEQEQLSMTTLSRLRLSVPSDWRPQIFGEEIDEVLATLAMEADSAQTRESAARAIGVLRSEAAIKEIAKRQRAGKKGALRALAFVRDEAPQLPDVVSQQARLYAWLDNTWRRITDKPMGLVWRYASASFFAALAFWFYAYANISGAAIFFAERWGKSLSTGATVGLVIGIVVILAAAILERLRGFWHWWARLIASTVLGYLTGLLVWNVFTWFFLYLEPPADAAFSYLNGVLQFTGVQAGALGFAFAFALRSAFGAPGWLATIVAALSIYVPIRVTWEVFAPPIIYTRPGDHIDNYAIVMVVLIALGAYLPVIVSEMLRWIRRINPLVRKTTTPPTAV